MFVISILLLWGHLNKTNNLRQKNKLTTEISKIIPETKGEWAALYGP